MINDKIKNIILGFQRNEITEHFVYSFLSARAKSAHNREILRKISEEEMRHYEIWRRYSGQEVKPDNLKRLFYTCISAAFGVTFGVKLMEAGEKNAQVSYSTILASVPEALKIQKEENEHENALIKIIEEGKLKYIGSIVLGLNDALVEFTGALAGFTFALQNSRLIGMLGLIMGISASFSMAASEYLSTKAEAGTRSPLRASIYTGIAYIFTVISLVLPYLIFTNPYLSLFSMLCAAILLIFVFTFYSSVVQEAGFKSRFLEMLSVSMGVAALGFFIGLAVKRVMGIGV